ncbi:MAG: histidine ammonia-lyase [candidate division Zixibacteria bacterium]|nr:histidine ammonia-lyase [candidate division Zixibacteria bacterium]
MKEITITGEGLSFDDVNNVCRNGAKIKLSKTAQAAIKANRAVIERKVKAGEAIYGVTTGIGEFARISISVAESAELQKRIVYSHAAAVGDTISEADTRVAMLLRVNTLSKGYSAVRPILVDTLVQMLNKGVHPIMYEKGSLGTSGDLAPLSQMAEVVMGEGFAHYKDKKMTGAKAMKAAGIAPVVLSFKEGLGLINGTQAFTGVGALALFDIFRLAKNMLIASGMTIDAVGATTKGYDPRPHKIRNHRGQQVVAENIRRLIAGSATIPANKTKVQDAYSLRCCPQILGPSLDAISYGKEAHLNEMNGVSDNPLFFTEDDDYIAAGNFHGQPTAMAQDFLSIAVAEFADLSERHTNRLLNPVLSGLPDFLVEGKGLNSGLMVSQYTAACLVSENKILAHPAVVDNISVSADQEDHVCMGYYAAKKLTEIVRNTEIVVGIQMMCNAQALDFRRPLKAGKGTEAAYKVIRAKLTRLINDRPLYPDIELVTQMVRDGSIVEAVEKAVGELRL